jgi:hemerythrin-like metal-binding protein
VIVPITQFSHVTIGVAVLDKAHLEFLLFCEDMQHASTREELLHDLEALKDMWSSHIATENWLMKKFMYPFINTHVEEHFRISGKLQRAIAEASAFNSPSIIDIRERLVTNLLKCLLDHLETYDSQLSEFIPKDAF